MSALPLDALPGSKGHLTVAAGLARRRMLVRWSTGLAVGVVSGLLPLAIGTLGLALALPGAIWSLVARPRGVALSGFMAGLGGTWLIVWARAMQSCVGVNTPTDGCVGPDLSGWLIVPIAILAAAGAIAVVTSLRRN